MYKNNLVVSIKSDGKILREKGDNVYLPFASEYSIYIKNLASSKAKVKISIDGEDVLNGNSLLIEPNDILELEGFMKNNIATNKFKFIEKTEEISDFRGDKIDDGLIRVEFWYEKKKPIVQEVQTTYTPMWYSTPFIRGIYNSDESFTNTDYVSTQNLNCSSLDSSIHCNFSSNSRSLDKGLSLDSLVECSSVNVNNVYDGITVKGSEVNQEFEIGSIGTLEEESTVMVLQLKGVKENKEKVEKPLTVKDKIQCKICGHISKSHAKFCSNCGTFLE